MSIKYNGKLIAGKYKTQIVTDATESNKGLIRIATLEEVNTGTNNTTAVTPKDLATKQNTLTAGEGIKIENGVISTESTKILTDNVTIIQNDDNTITSIGTKTKSNTNLYDWVGTEEEYNTSVSSGIITEDTQCIITDDEQELIGNIELNIPTKVSDLANDSNFISSVELDTKQDIISDLDTIRAGATLGSTALQSIPAEYVTETELNAKGYLTSYTETDPIYTADKPNIANINLDNLSNVGETHFNNKYIQKSGDTMSGPLNFNESPVVHDFIRNSNCYVQRTNRILSNADPVDSTIYVTGVSIVDETSYEIAKTEIAKYKDGTIRHNFVAHNINGVGTDWVAIGVGYKPNGTCITYAPTPPTSDNSTQIATTAWVKALPRLIETWESEWFASPGASKSVSFNLAGTGMNATNAPRIFMEMIGKVVTANGGYAVGDIIYPQFANYNGSTGKKEEGQSVFFRGNTLTYAQGNSTGWVATKATGGLNGVGTEHIQIKIILRRFSN